MNNSLTLCALGGDNWEAASEAGVQSRPGSHSRVGWKNAEVKHQLAGQCMG